MGTKNVNTSPMIERQTPPDTRLLAYLNKYPSMAEYLLMIYVLADVPEAALSSWGLT
jgi:hypothetical protein